MRKVAVAAGVSAMTVSRALRNNNHVSNPEIVRIRAIAEKMGYSLNPYLSSWMRRMRQGRQIQNQEIIAFVIFNRQQQVHPWQQNFTEGAVRFAQRLGYRLDIFALDEYANRGALFRTLYSRGIRGVIMATLLEEQIPAEAWQHSLVCWHRPFADERADFVDVDYYEGMMLALKRLNARGYRRIAYWASKPIEQHKRWEAAYEYHQRDVAPSDRVPVLNLFPAKPQFSDLRRWVKAHRPEAVICVDNSLYHALNSTKPKVLRNLAWASLGTESDPALAGINQHLDMVGEAAVRIVTRKMELNEIGPPAQPRTSIILPEWQDGPSLLPRKCACLSPA